MTAPAAAAVEPWQKGANFTAWWHDAYEQPAADASLRELAATGTERVAIVTTWYMDSPTASGIHPVASKTPSDESLLHVMRTARELGLEVVLKPHVDVIDGSFRGDIAPSDRVVWFDSYRVMSNHYAELAARAQARMLIVGTELTSMTTEEGEWRRVVTETRARFGGELTFAANWIDGARKVAFWDALDYVGVDAYMPLADALHPTTDELAAAWHERGYVAQLADLHARTGKPVLLTELGYQSRQGTAMTPWGGAAGAIDQEPQARAFEAAYRAFWGAPWFAGIYWWDWSASNAADAGGHPFAGKAAAGVVAAWNARVRSDAASPSPSPVAAPAPEQPVADAIAAGVPGPVRPAAVPTVRLRARRGARLDGTVRSGGAPCPARVTIRLRGRGARRSRTTHTTDAGNFKVFLRGFVPGRYRAAAVVKSATCGSARSRGVTLRIR